jgi:hypothetical protein
MPVKENRPKPMPTASTRDPAIALEILDETCRPTLLADYSGRFSGMIGRKPEAQARENRLEVRFL